MLDEKRIGEELLAMGNEVVARDGRGLYFTPELKVSDTGLCRVSVYVGPLEDYRLLSTGRSHGTVQEAMDGAWSAIRELPTQDEAKRQRFASAIAAAIEAGNDAGIDLEYVNPLKEMMQRLSENAITKVAS